MAGETVIAQARPTLMPVAREHAQRLAVIRQTRPHIADGPSYARQVESDKRLLPSRPACRFVPARVSEKGLEAGWREHFKDATSVRDHAPVCIGHSLGAEDQVTWPCPDFRATDREDMFTLRL
jgi:hypothetical protein